MKQQLMQGMPLRTMLRDACLNILVLGAEVEMGQKPATASLCIHPKCLHFLSPLKSPFEAVLASVLIDGLLRMRSLKSMHASMLCGLTIFCIVPDHCMQVCCVD